MSEVNKRQEKKKRKNVDKWCDMQIWGYKAEKKLSREYHELCICWKHMTDKELPEEGI